MSGSPQVVPIKMDLDVCDIGDEFEMQDDEDELELAEQMLAILKSPIGIGVSAAVVIGLITIFVLTSGSLQMFGSPKLDNERAVAGKTSAEEAEVQAEQELANKTEKDKSDGVDSEEEEEKPDDYQDQYGWVSFSNGGGVYHTAPTTISLQNGDVTAELTLSVGIVVERDAARHLLDEGLTVNFMKIETAQSIDIGPYLAWEVPGLITKGLKQRIEAKYPDMVVQGILIRDFDLT